MATQMKNGEPEVVTQVATLLQKDNNQAKIIITDSTLIEQTLAKLKALAGVHIVDFTETCK